jgi:hypothetical protein
LPAYSSRIVGALHGRFAGPYLRSANAGATGELARVSVPEFEALLRTYPRPLEARPPLSQRKVNFRAWLDASLGEWPENVVAKAWTRGRCTGYQILLQR